MNVTSGAEGQDVQTIIDNGEHFEAVLPLPTCRSNSGCRSVVVHDNNAPQPEQNFNLVDFVHINAEVKLFHKNCKNDLQADCISK